MQHPLPHIINGNHFWLSSQRCIFWEEQNTLIVCDLHIGKTGHFRKNGIAVSQRVYTEDLQRLLSCVLFFKVSKLIVVGDLSHSRSNKELELFKKWRNDFPSLKVHLVKGNHDILHEAWYKESHITVHHDKYCLDDFCFCHDVCLAEQEKGKYIFSGHMHPGVKVRGMAKQSLCFPCFYFTETFCVLPAFSKFTGLALIKPGNGESVFAIVENDIMKLR
ncbi:MAG TPA: ligase-associated DNA damage response endonuclease PdeM [Chitinophagaceae bacterium]